ncbi:ribonuclease H-like domain-containing protein [Tanacetum coccineum]
MVHNVFNSRESDVDDNPLNDRFKTGEGFHAVPPPYTGNYMPPRPDISFAGLDESIFKSAVRKTTTSVLKTKTSISKTSKDIVEKPKTVRPSAPIIEECDTDNDNDSVFRPKSDQTKPKFTKINFVKSGENVKSVNKENTHRQVEYPMIKSKSNFVPTVVATKSGQVQVNAAKQSSSRAATSISTARPVNTDAPKPKVNNVTTAGPKTVVSAAVGNGENVVKSSECWIWRPIGNVIDHNSKDSGSYMLKRFDCVDLQGRLNGCSRHMTGNKSFLTDYQEIDGGFVAFGGSPKGGKITRKGKIRTGKLDFEDTECLVLSPDFKLLDESQVLLKVPRQNNMYIFDLKNVVPSGGLTCLFAKAIIDESNLWHRRLGHINFKTMNKLVRGNLVRGLPSKLFENDHTCVACQKGKQHKASSNIDEEQGSGPDWLFDIDLLTNSINYEPSLEDAVADDAGKNTTKELANKGERNGQEKEGGASNKEVSTVSPSISAAGQSFINANDLPTDPLMPDLEDTTDLLNTGIFSGAYDDEDVGAKADLNNLEITMNVSPIPTTRIHKDHPKEQIIRDPLLAPQTRRMTKSS